MTEEKIIKALLIEDDPLCQIAQKKLLEAEGILVDATATAIQGIDLLTSQELNGDEKPYDIIFLDLNLPDMNGELIADIIRKTEIEDVKIPIVVVTGTEPEGEELARYIQLGITEVMEKPMTKVHVQEIIKKYI